MLIFPFAFGGGFKTIFKPFVGPIPEPFVNVNISSLFQLWKIFEPLLASLKLLVMYGGLSQK